MSRQGLYRVAKSLQPVLYTGVGPHGEVMVLSARRHTVKGIQALMPSWFKMPPRKVVLEILRPSLLLTESPD